MKTVSLTIDGETHDYVRADFVPPKIDCDFVIVRCRNAGVHAGELVSRDEHTLVLANSRRLWRWYSQFTLSELAILGPRADKIKENKYAIAVPRITLTVSDVAEVINCTEVARVAIMAIGAYNGE